MRSVQQTEMDYGGTGGRKDFLKGKFWAQNETVKKYQ